MNAAFEIIPFEVEVTAELTTSNFPEVREIIRQFIGSINMTPSTDEEFGNAVEDVKKLKFGEDNFKAAQETILAKASSINDLLKEIGDESENIRQVRLKLEKAIETRKDEVKREKADAALDQIDCAPRHKGKFKAGIEQALKAKRTLDSMDKALEIQVTSVNATIAKSRASIDSFVKAHGEELVLDREDLEIQTPDAVEAELRRRFEAKRAIEQRKQLEAEAAKLKAEAAAAQPTNITPIKGVLPPSDLPQPPKIGGLPTGPSPRAEWEAFATACRTTFSVLKQAKEGLKHDENVSKAQILADAINAAWKEINTQRKEA